MALHAALASLAAALLLGASGAARAQSAPTDLTGTWLGATSCRFHLAGAGIRANGGGKNLKFELRQVSVGPNGAEYAVRFDGRAYSARTIDLGGTGSGEGLLALADCANSDIAAFGETEVGRLEFRVNASTGTARISGRTLFNETDPFELDFALKLLSLGTGTCKLRFKRVDVALPAPEVPGCATGAP